LYHNDSQNAEKIISLHYVQNEELWLKYCSSKFDFPNVPEVYRFHGTPFKNIDGICEHGFLTSKDVAGRGTTIWAAENASYSVGYAAKGPASDGTHVMFLAKMLSSTNNISTVKDGSQMYPEYIITFK